ncbi:bacterioferritin-associated ferredoxin [Catenovulum sp. SX2]|uniref:bacterioferritin-associated ferredoxin n=1 Tax=Catenovulum TaxID=1172191 RepID=UPI0002F078BE|nr:bacterioferritin-associated ferredoxin [Catenovulum agarivorans]
MFVCLCNGITDKDIIAAAEKGCSSLVELRKQMDIANDCGKCRKQAINILREAQPKHKIEDNDLLIAAFA